MDAREHVDLLVLFVEQVLELAHFGLETSDAVFQRLCVTSRKSSPTQLVARLALEPDIGALRTAWSYAVTPDLLAATPVTGLCDPTRRSAPHANHLHR